MAFALTGTSSGTYDPYRNFPQTTPDGRRERTQEFGTVTTESAAELTDPNAQDHADSPEVADYVSRLSSADREVRAHEAAHVAAGGSNITSGVSFSFQTGPDGKAYAVGGEVGIDISPVPGNPQATITKMMMVRAAALAPADPSPQDLAVAAAAAQIEAAARAQIAAQAQAKFSEIHSTGKTAVSPYSRRPNRVGQHVNAVA